MSVHTGQTSPCADEERIAFFSPLKRLSTKTACFLTFFKVYEAVMEAISRGTCNLLPVNVLALVTDRLGIDIEIRHYKSVSDQCQYEKSWKESIAFDKALAFVGHAPLQPDKMYWLVHALCCATTIMPDSASL